MWPVFVFLKGIYIYIYIYIYITFLSFHFFHTKPINDSPHFFDKLYRHFLSKVGDLSQGQPEGSLFNSYYSEVLGRALLLSLECSTLPVIRILYCCKEISSTIFKVFGITRPLIKSLIWRDLGLNPSLYQLGQWAGIYIYIYIRINVDNTHICSYIYIYIYIWG